MTLALACSAKSRTPDSNVPPANARNAAAGDAASGASAPDPLPANAPNAGSTSSGTAGLTGPSMRDATVGSLDAAVVPGDAGVREPDAAAADAAAIPPVCALDAGTDPGCASHLCSADGNTFLVVEGDEPWMVGGLDWVASVCELPLGWASASTADRRQLVYAVARQDVNALNAGSLVLVYWGNPTSPPTSARVCAFKVRRDSFPACPETTTPPRHPSLIGCRGPRDPGCAVCKEPSRPGYRSSEGDWYNVSSTEAPAGCEVDCPVCATCDYRTDEQSRALGERPECEPCPTERGIDSCFVPRGCACWCETRTQLRNACPTLVP